MYVSAMYRLRGYRKAFLSWGVGVHQTTVRWQKHVFVYTHGCRALT